MLHLTVNDGRTYDIEATGDSLHRDGEAIHLDISTGAGGVMSVLYEGRSYTAELEHLDEGAKELHLRIDGQLHTVRVEEPLDRLLKKLGMDAAATAKAESVKAPMPGMVLKVLVAPGQAVVKGDALILLEAMKMENILKASAPGTVKAVRVAERTAVEKGAVLIEME